MDSEYKPMIVNWVDSTQPTSNWCFIDSVPPLEVVNCVSVGWNVGETDEVLMLASNLGGMPEEGIDQASGVIRIPKVSIISSKTLSED